MPAPAPPRRSGLSRRQRARRRRVLIVAVLVTAVATVAVAALLISITERRWEARHPFVRVTEVDEQTIDPSVWGANWPHQYDTYRRTVDYERTRYGGSDAVPKQKLDADPWLRTMWAGYAFSLDYRESRGHAFMLHDQDHTERVAQRPQPGRLPALPLVGPARLPVRRQGRHHGGLPDGQQHDLERGPAHDRRRRC
jgi:nitrite reductase (cytochrome c-552)